MEQEAALSLQREQRTTLCFCIGSDKSQSILRSTTRRTGRAAFTWLLAHPALVVGVHLAALRGPEQSRRGAQRRPGRDSAECHMLAKTTLAPNPSPTEIFF